jgi:hypothetical protein
VNRFQQHHRDEIQFDYSCFDRMILHGCIRHFMHTECAGNVRWFLRSHRQIECSRKAFAKISRDYHDWVENYAKENAVDILQPDRDEQICRDKVSREALVEPYFRQLGQRPGVAVILKIREPERVAVGISFGVVEVLGPRRNTATVRRNSRCTSSAAGYKLRQGTITFS